MFWERLTLLLTINNMTQADLSRACNIPTPTISMWKAGHQPTIKTLLHLSNFFKVSVDYLIGNQDIIFKTEEKQLNKEQKELVIKFEQADEPEKIVIKKLLHMQ